MIITQSDESQRQMPAFDLDALNQRFEGTHPKDVLAWCIENIPTGLMQVSAFNIDDMVITDLLYRELKPAQPIPILFLETLHHFPKTLEFVDRAKQTYGLNLKIYKTTKADSREDFAAFYGKELWNTDINKFHYVTKLEPLKRGLEELNTVAWITGRRRDQSSTRVQMPYFEVDTLQLLKVNPLATWTRKASWAYAAGHSVMYNLLHDQGYASVGDQPLTTPITDGEDERSGRWRGMNKTECGIHL